MFGYLQTSGEEIRMAPKNTSFKVILGSSSISRQRILDEMGYEFTIMSADIDEKSIRRDKPEELVMALADAKADAILSRLKASSDVEERPTLLITADTVVVYQGTIREKPSCKEEAREYIKGYSGSHASVVGSIMVTNLTTGNRAGGYDIAEVYFYKIPDEIIDDIIEEGTSLNVAGGLMLEHPLVMPFVDSVVGTVDSVMGLSKSLVEKLIHEAL